MDGPRTSQRLAAELLGTAFLVFIGVGSVAAALIINGTTPLTMADMGVISLSFGTVVVATVYAFGHVSGNHINPAVTVALALTRQFPWRDVPAYLAAQLLGAILGSVAIIGTLGYRAHEVGLGVATPGTDVGAGQTFVAEFVGTFILVLVVLLVIRREATPMFAGVAIGLAVFAVIIPLAPATGAAVNPARTLGPMLVQQLGEGSVQWSRLPVYLGAEFLAAAAAAATAAFITHPVRVRPALEQLRDGSVSMR